MNRYPLWKYAMLVVALLVGLLYTLPNFFGEAPAVQVSSAKATIRVGQDTVKRVHSQVQRKSLPRSTKGWTARLPALARADSRCASTKNQPPSRTANTRYGRPAWPIGTKRSDSPTIR